MPNIRPGEEQDLEHLNELYNHYVRTSACTFDIEPISMEARRAWFEDFGGPYRLMVAVDEAEVIGYATTSRLFPRQAYETSVSSTVYIAEGHHGRGLGTALYRELYQAIDGEDIHRAYAGITMPNPGSVSLHERFGFRGVALFTEQGRKFGKYWDVAWYEKEL